jgi:hypothetical protein
VVLAAVGDSGGANLAHAAPALRADRRFVQQVAAQAGFFALQYVSAELRRDKQVGRKRFPKLFHSISVLRRHLSLGSGGSTSLPLSRHAVASVTASPSLAPAAPDSRRASCRAWQVLLSAMTRGMPEGAAKVFVGLGHIVALHHRPSTLYQGHSETRCLYFRSDHATES